MDFRRRAHSGKAYDTARRAFGVSTSDKGKQGIVEGEPAPRPRPVFVALKPRMADAFVHAPVQMAVTPDLY